ncbi:MAG: TonB family protein [Acidobacteriota bacterium]|nr:TonB family protein [Acidobacteriota bacterium]
MSVLTNRAALIGSLLVHVVLLLLLGSVRSGPSAPPPPPPEPKHVVTHLIDPPTELTQKAPNRGKLSKELIAEAILPRPQVRHPSPAPITRRMSSPPPTPKAQAAGEPPRIELAAREIPKLPQAAPVAPPPPVEKPKLAFESPAQQAAPVGKAAANPALVAQNPIQDAVRNIARNGSTGAQQVGDAAADLNSTGPGLNLPPSPGRPRSSLELKSDPMGVDFKPYLIRVLATVRRNWFAIYPETARMGQRGRVLVEFAVANDGTITKVVFASQSGSRPLDEAAVAALSASNRLPPLPPEFKGSRIVLQFTFSYNMPSR